MFNFSKTIDVEPSDTIKSMKDKITEKEGYPFDNPRIKAMFYGKYLEHEKGETLANYYI